MTARKRSPEPTAPADPADSPALRLERLMAAPILQPSPPRWNEPVFLTPPRPGILGDRWRSMFAAIRPPARGNRLAILPPGAGMIGSITSGPPLFSRPGWKLPVTESPLRARRGAPPASRPPQAPPSATTVRSSPPRPPAPPAASGSA